MGEHIFSYPSPVPFSSKYIQINQRIPASDGIELLADLYIPGGIQPPFPAVIEITPYGGRFLSRIGEIYATRGYLFLAVDARGRYRSSGNWDPLTYDQKDGHRVIKWMADHKLCNKRIGTRGHSYSGYSQILTAINAPKELQAMVVGFAPGDPFDNVPFQGGAYDLTDFFWLLGMTGRTCPEDDWDDEFDTINPENKIINQKESQLRDRNALFKKAFLSRPFKDLDLRFGVRQDIFREWLQHWRFDEFWRARSIGNRIAETSVPTLHITGWWDSNGRGATSFYKGMRQRAVSNFAKEGQRLLIGAWEHDLIAPDCQGLPLEDAQQIERAACRDPLNDELSWFDKYLKDGNSLSCLDYRVTLFITGLYQWMDFKDWPPPETKSLHCYLQAGPNRSTGGLSQKFFTEGTSSSTYLFDPEDPTPYAPKNIDGERALFDDTLIEEEREDLLIFDTEILYSPLLLIGEVSLLLYAQSDVCDFDLYAKLLDVYPEGKAIFLTDGIIRARFREGWDQPKLMNPEEINLFTIDLWHLGHMMRKGHRIRCTVSSGALGRFDINPCTGGDLAEETKSSKAKVTIFHNQKYPSSLVLPVWRGKEPEEF